MQRTMSQEDRRNNFVILTEKGMQVQKALLQIEEQVHTDLTFTLTPSEIKSCMWVMRKLTGYDEIRNKIIKINIRMELKG